MNDDQFKEMMATLSSIGLYAAIVSAQVLRKEPLSDNELDGVQAAHAQMIQIVRGRLAAGQNPFVDWKLPFEALHSGRADKD